MKFRVEDRPDQLDIEFLETQIVRGLCRHGSR